MVERRRFPHGKQAGSDRETRGRFSPNTVFGGAHKEPGEDEKSPLLMDRKLINGKATAYVCENYACKLPVTTAAELAELLG